MEISHASLETQSVALGTMGEGEEVTVSTDTEFMMAIAHGIYSDKALALVRELLCNARDGHFAAGTPNAAIIVTLTENMLVVRDNGTGIPLALFRQNYMTFGKSTKRLLKNQTGGFGVGSKVPWAVCDTFSARNFHLNQMTSFVIMKSDPAMQGKPSCTPIMTIDSIEHAGVEVSVPFPEKMHNDINNRLYHFAKELGLNIVLNGRNLLDAFDLAYDADELSSKKFTVLSRHPHTVITESNIYVRLGDVIYPVECQEEYKDAFTLLTSVSRDGPILLQAEPDSIVPTMSRESLSYTDKTMETLRQLMSNVLQLLADKIDDYAIRVADALPAFHAKDASNLTNIWNKNDDVSQSLRRMPILKPAGVSTSEHSMLVENMRRWLRHTMPYIETQVTLGKAFREEIRGSVSEIFTEYLKTFNYFDHDIVMADWHQDTSGRKQWDYKYYYEILRWQKELKEEPILHEVLVTENGSALRYWSTPSRSHFKDLASYKDLHDFKVKEHFSPGDVARVVMRSKVIVLMPVFKALLDRAKEVLRPNQKWWANPYTTEFGALSGARYLKLSATAKPAEIAALAAKYRAMGYTVIDLSGPTAAELEARKKAAEERALLRNTPLPTLVGMLREKYHHGRKKEIACANNLESNPKFKGKPLYLVLDRGKHLHHSFSSFEGMMNLIRFVGTDVICISTKPELARMIKEGRASVEDELVRLLKDFYARPGMFEKLYYSQSIFVEYTDADRYLTKLLFNRVAVKMTAEEIRIMDCFKKLGSAFPELKKVIEAKVKWAYKACSPSAYYTRKIAHYGRDNFIHHDQALHIAFYGKPGPRRTLARAILKQILKG